ncbi:MAG: DNA mismatch repair protein MutS [Inquilinus sp.]|nr:DNA mismatch repair protein MutS [Inquilinus sp.]
MSRSRKPSSEDEAVWRALIRTVTPLPGRELPPAPAPTSGPEKPPAAPAPVPSVRRQALRAPLPMAQNRLPALAPGATPGVDRRTAERLRRGRLPIEARLDLHGMTQPVAHRALNGFVTEAYRQGRRAVLVITGKGTAGDGVLRAQVPNWLNEPEVRRKVLAIQPAQPKDGGAGALYVLLKRQR